MTVLYLAGPMSGVPNYNFPAFYAAARNLRAVGYHVVSPAELHTGEPGSMTWQDYMRKDLVALLTYADAVALMPGSHNSQGARVERKVAEDIGLPVMSVDDWLVNAE